MEKCHENDFLKIFSQKGKWNPFQTTTKRKRKKNFFNAQIRYHHRFFLLLFVGSLALNWNFITFSGFTSDVRANFMTWSDVRTPMQHHIDGLRFWCRYKRKWNAILSTVCMLCKNVRLYYVNSGMHFIILIKFPLGKWIFNCDSNRINAGKTEHNPLCTMAFGRRTI